MSKLHISKFGKGPDLILLHGWGSSSKVWHTCIESLCGQFCVWCVDLPGHGESHSVKWNGSIEQAMSMLAEELPLTCSIVGWSLGGLIAQLFAKYYPQRVQNLMLIASTPKFIASTNWPHGMSKDTFLDFAQEFSKSPQKTLYKFCALQVLNTTSSSEVRPTLVNALSKQQLANIQWGLQWLQNIDLRTDEVLSRLPVVLLQGDKDAVCSYQAAKQTVNNWENASLEKVPNAGHAPFVSHRDHFIKKIESW